VKISARRRWIPSAAAALGMAKAKESRWKRICDGSDREL
jgi:hypothetical protein